MEAAGQSEITFGELSIGIIKPDNSFDRYIYSKAGNHQRASVLDKDFINLENDDVMRLMHKSFSIFKHLNTLDFTFIYNTFVAESIDIVNNVVVVDENYQPTHNDTIIAEVTGHLLKNKLNAMAHLPQMLPSKLQNPAQHEIADKYLQEIKSFLRLVQFCKDLRESNHVKDIDMFQNVLTDYSNGGKVFLHANLDGKNIMGTSSIHALELMTNSRKLFPEGCVDVSIIPDGRHKLNISVTDYGKGIPPEQFEDGKIFNGKSTDNLLNGGFGLSAIKKDVVDTRDGKMVMESYHKIDGRIWYSYIEIDSKDYRWMTSDAETFQQNGILFGTKTSLVIPIRNV